MFIINCHDSCDNDTDGTVYKDVYLPRPGLAKLYRGPTT